tara:strand:- start:471 stop:1004 length:534 start_codon:yes stop_codon:yes gene_type:complete
MFSTIIDHEGLRLEWTSVLSNQKSVPLNEDEVSRLVEIIVDHETRSRFGILSNFRRGQEEPKDTNTTESDDEAQLENRARKLAANFGKRATDFIQKASSRVSNTLDTVSLRMAMARIDKDEDLVVSALENLDSEGEVINKDTFLRLMEDHKIPKELHEYVKTKVHCEWTRLQILKTR